MKALRQKWKGGFTLIEILIVITVIALIAAYAIPSYTESVRRGNRADAKSQMLQLQTWMQQQYNLPPNITGLPGPFQYPVDLARAPAMLQQSPGTGTAKYTITLANALPQSYTLVATPTGAYANGDPQCGVLSITNDGRRMANNGDTTAALIDTCWNK